MQPCRGVSIVITTAVLPERLQGSADDLLRVVGPAELPLAQVPMLEQAARGLTLAVLGTEPEEVVPTLDVALDDTPLGKPLDGPTDD